MRLLSNKDYSSLRSSCIKYNFLKSFEMNTRKRSLSYKLCKMSRTWHWHQRKNLSSMTQNIWVITVFLTIDLMNRSKHSVHKKLKSQSLFCNSMLMMLIKAIINNAFWNYSNMKELLKIESLKNEMYHLRQNESVLDKLFFHVIFNKKMKKVNTFSKCLRKLRVHVEYLYFSIIHDFRAKSLYFVDLFSLSS